MKSCDWIVFHDGTKGDDAYAMECLRCGQIQRFAVLGGIDLNTCLAAAKVFQRQHQKCKPKPEATHEA